MDASDHELVDPEEGGLQRALSLLDAEIAKSELLMSVAPIRLVSIGSLAALLLHNRQVTMSPPSASSSSPPLLPSAAPPDIECMLDSNLAAAAEYHQDFKQAVASTARLGSLAPGWLSEQLDAFITRDRRMRMFLESVEQNIVLFSGANLVVFAGRLDWALERKLRRASHGRGLRLRDGGALKLDGRDRDRGITRSRSSRSSSNHSSGGSSSHSHSHSNSHGSNSGAAKRNRSRTLVTTTSTSTSTSTSTLMARDYGKADTTANVDILDAAALIRYMREHSDTPQRPFSFDYVRGLNYNGFDVPPTDEALRKVARCYIDAYSEQGLVELTWDKEHERHKYKGLRDEWVWY